MQPGGYTRITSETWWVRSHVRFWFHNGRLVSWQNQTSDSLPQCLTSPKGYPAPALLRRGRGGPAQIENFLGKTMPIVGVHLWGQGGGQIRNSSYGLATPATTAVNNVGDLPARKYLILLLEASIGTPTAKIVAPFLPEPSVRDAPSEQGDPAPASAHELGPSLHLLPSCQWATAAIRQRPHCNPCFRPVLHFDNRSVLSPSHMMGYI